MVGNLVDSVAAPKSESAVTALTHLLIISDEVESSQRSSPETKARTPKHFFKFLVPLLTEPHLNRAATYVVKNIGDSLMIRVAVSTNRDELSQLFHKIMSVQQELASLPGRDAIKIRVFVARCDPHVPGGEIGDALKKLLTNEQISTIEHGKKLPPPRDGGTSWFDGDMFGEVVNKAFRAAAIPKGPELIIDDDVASLLFQEAGIVSQEGDIDVKDLHVSRRLAFAPIRGLEDIYDVGKKHLYLREISSPGSTANSLKKRQQKARVITELCWGKADDTLVNSCIEELKKIDSGAGYFRFRGKVTERWWDAGKSKTKGGILLLGAYPELDTYWSVRRELKVRKEPGRILGDALTSLVWEQSAIPTWAPRLWYPENITSFLFVKLKARDPTDEPATDPTVKAIKQNPNILGGWVLYDAGLLMGEWDAYAIFTPKTPSQGGTMPTEEPPPREYKLVAKHFAGYVCEVVWDR